MAVNNTTEVDFVDIINLIFAMIGFYFFLKILDKIIDIYGENNRQKLSKELIRYGFISKKDLHHLDPFEFEKWCGEFLERMGYTDIQVTPEKIDGGKDIICKYNGEAVYVECKRYSADIKAPFQVSRDIVQKLIGAMIGDKVNRGIIITTGIVTDRSRDYVATLPSEYKVELIDGDQLIKMHRELRLREINATFGEQGI